MQVFLQNRDTGWLLSRNNAWVDDEQDAMRFRNSIAALGYYMRSGMRRGQVLLRVEGTGRDLDVIVPLDRQ
jgi:hypothetical protein